ncbi:MAG: hypothetical protein NTW86_11405 [Candidatus Sumerlaeota bacterium]|nr:hypothetical protein [Candidatus Sumerlaeota bacterium]
MNRVLRKLWRLAALGAFAAACLAGCRFLPFHKAEESGRIWVPEYATAREQYQFAFQKQQEEFIPPTDSARKEERLRRILAGYEKVIERFPDDRVYTPLSKMQIGELYLGYGQPKVALQKAEEILAAYGDIEFIDAKTRFDRGRALEALGRRVEAQQAYKDCMDRYQDSKDKKSQEIVRWSRQMYDRIIPLEEKARKPAPEEKKDEGGGTVSPF